MVSNDYGGGEQSFIETTFLGDCRLRVKRDSLALET